jgi:hypothetical protein
VSGGGGGGGGGGGVRGARRRARRAARRGVGVIGGAGCNRGGLTSRLDCPAPAMT